MRVHHLNCLTMCPPLGRAMRNEGAAHLVAHCLLVEAPDGLVLVDTGIGTADLADPTPRLGWAFTRLLRPRLDPAQTAVAHVRRLGFSPSDVRHVILTHLDVDHVGGLLDFPEARAHVMMAEQEAAVLRTGLWEKVRYRSAQVDAWSRWSLYTPRGASWFGFDAVKELVGLQGDILLVPLHGHTRGHTGVAVRADRGWLLHAGDAYFHRDQLVGRSPPLPLRLMERLNDTDHAARVHNRDRLVTLAREHAGEIEIFCAHDPVELARLAAR